MVSASNTLCMKVQLSISGIKLKSLDIFSKSDPRCSVYELERSALFADKWVLRGQTEVLNNQQNPDFAQTITLDYYFEKTQKLKFVMEDVDGNSFDKIGSVKTTIAAIMGKKAQTFD